MADYDPSIPQANDNLSTSQVELLNNFTELNTLMALDHYAWNDGTVVNRGRHRKSTYIDQLAIDPTTGPGEVAVYNKANVLYARGQNNGTVYQLAGSFTKSQNGYVDLYGGIRMMWGRATIVGGTASIAVLFSGVSLPNFSAAPYSIQVTPYDTPITGSTPREIGVTAGSIATTGFTIISFNGVVPGGGCQVGWLAIGAQ